MNAAAHATIPNSFAPIPVTLATDPTVSPSAKAVYLALASHANYQTRKCWPSIGRIAGMTGLSDETVSRAMLELERHGWISRSVRRSKNGRWNGYLYVVHLEACPPKKPELEPIPTAPGFYRTGKIWDERNPKKHNEKEHTHDQVAEIPEQDAPVVCLSGDEKPFEAPESPRKVVFLVKRPDREKIGPEILEAINRQIDQGTKAGKIGNPEAYRRTLTNLAQRGEYVPPGAQPSSSANFEKTRQYIETIDQAREKCSEDRSSNVEMLKAWRLKYGASSTDPNADDRGK